jgi:uncharacterized protein
MLQAVLMMTVGFARRKKSISLGDGGDEALQFKIRRHGNLTENAPIFLILLGLLETSGGSSTEVLGLAFLFVAARFSHAAALSGPNTPIALRAGGAFGTVLAILGTAFTLVWHLSHMA